ncbi:MAG: helix-turn-helix domain-containing protein [Acholeplasmataceae bacterium]
MRYPNLEAELKRHGLTREKLAELLRINISTVSSKLTGKSSISIEEAKTIADAIGENNELKYLFETKD